MRNAAHTATPATLIKTKTSTTRLLIKELHYKTDGGLFEIHPQIAQISYSKYHTTQEPDREKVETEMIKTERV